MSRYLILIILNTPLVMAGLLNTIIAYKLGRTSRRYLVVRTIIWVGVFAGLVFAESIYGFLFAHNLTQTEPLSLFDVIQITGIVFVFFIASRALARVDLLERRVQDLHQELSIRLSRDEQK